jgi:hypothetical protein
LTGVALCHDILIALALMRARRRLGLAGFAAMLAAHVGLTFEIVFAGHARSMRWRGIGSFPPVNEFIGLPRFAVHDRKARPRGIHLRDGFGLMRKPLIVRTILTCALLAVTVWTVLGSPKPPPGRHLPSRTAAVR